MIQVFSKTPTSATGPSTNYITINSVANGDHRVQAPRFSDTNFISDYLTITVILSVLIIWKLLAAQGPLDLEVYLEL